VMVAAQTIKLHPDTMTGHTVEIEMRSERELLSDEERAAIIGDATGEVAETEATEDSDQTQVTDSGLTVENPAFDVTPPRYVDAIVTERGQFPPESIVTLMRELFGEPTDDPWES